MGDAILRIPRDARVRAYRTRDTYDGVVPATSKRQPYCHSSYIELSGVNRLQIQISRAGRLAVLSDNRTVWDLAGNIRKFLLIIGQFVIYDIGAFRMLII